MSNRPAKAVLLAASAVSALAGAVLAGAAPALAAEADAAEDAPQIIVYGRNTGYDAERTSTATRTDTPLVNVPQAITVLSREQLDDQGVEQLADALRYVPGVVLGQGEGHRDQVTLRGQASTADFFLDGVRDDAQYYRPLYNTERVEVLKGANAMIFGRGGGGGVINRVSKAPGFGRARGSMAAAMDSFGAWSLAGDANLPLSDALALRANATYEEFANHRDSYGGHFIGVAPTLGARLGDATTLVLAYEYAEDSRVTDRGVPSLGGLPISGHDQTFFGSPDVNRSEVTAHIARARIDHEFSSSLSANLTGQFARYDKYYGNVYPRAATATTVEFEGYDNTTRRENWIVQGNLVWTGETGPAAHTILLGFEASQQDTDDSRRLARFGTGLTARVTVPLDRPIVLPAISFGGLNRNSASDVRVLSAYVQDQIEIGEHVQIVAGLRYDDFRIASTNLVNGFKGERSDGKWSPRLGLILKPQENVSVYVSYALSFLPQSGEQFTVLDATTEALAPERFRNLEAGVKWDVTNDLAFTAAIYQLDRTNTRATDPQTGNAVLSGSSRVRGVEVSLVGQITPQLRTSLGYALQDGEIRTTTTAAPAGRRLDKLPRHQLSAWARYDVTPRIGLGMGVVHQSSQFATISNAVRLPAFTRIDGAIFFDVTERFTLQLNAENIGGARYYPSAHTDYNITTGEPFNVKVSARVKF